MADLDLNLSAHPEGSEARFVPLLHDFLKSSERNSLEKTASAIAAAARARYVNATIDNNLYVFSHICHELGERIPFDHPAQSKLVALIRKLATYEPFHYPYRDRNGNTRFSSHAKLFMLATESTSGFVPLSGDNRPLTDHVNSAAYIARLEEAGFVALSSSYSLASMQSAFEMQFPDISAQWRDVLVLCAAQHVFWNGSSLYRLCRDPPYYDWPNEGPVAGELWTGPATDLRGRWEFWKESFRIAAEQDHIKTQTGDQEAAKEPSNYQNNTEQSTDSAAKAELDNGLAKSKSSDARQQMLTRVSPLQTLRREHATWAFAAMEALERTVVF